MDLRKVDFLSAEKISELKFLLLEQSRKITYIVSNEGPAVKNGGYFSQVVCHTS